MKIALINENSQNSKNPMIEAAFKMAVESMSHTVLTIPKKYSSTRRARVQMRKVPREWMPAGHLDVWALLDTAAQVFGDFIHVLKRGARLFVGAMTRANATLSAIGARSLAVDAHAHRYKRDGDKQQNNDIDRGHRRLPFISFPTATLPYRPSFNAIFAKKPPAGTDPRAAGEKAGS